MITVAALYVAPGGAYYGLDGCEPWGLPERDARLYAGPHPVVAHPPCSRWCRLAGLVEKRWGHKKGDDGGCFAAALASVRRWGGVLEHPAHTDAWDAFGLPVPPAEGGWVRGLYGGWTCQIEQGKYGHRARKATWLYIVGIVPPPLKWGRAERGEALVSFCGNHTAADEDRPRCGKKEAKATPPEFQSLLLTLARGVIQPTTVRAGEVAHLGHAERAATPPPHSETFS